MSAPENRYENFLWAVIRQRRETYEGVTEEVALSRLVQIAAQNMEESGEISPEQLEGVGLKLELILLTAATFQVSAREEGEFLTPPMALGLALQRLCPLWPFC